MPALSQQVKNAGKEALHETTEAVGEQFGIKQEKGASHSAAEQLNILGEIREQIFGNKSEEQFQKDAQNAQMTEKFKTPEKKAQARQQLQQINTNPPPERPYEYKGPKVPTNSSNSQQESSSLGPHVPQKQQAPSLTQQDFTNSPETRQKQYG